jgi:hypothetical protein
MNESACCQTTFGLLVFVWRGFVLRSPVHRVCTSGCLEWTMTSRDDVDRPETRRGLKDSGIVADMPPDGPLANDARSTPSTSSEESLRLHMRGSPPDTARSRSSCSTARGRGGRELDDEPLSSFRSDSSTPEPPTSPRPLGLVNHPKIIKDKQLQQSLSLSSSFRAMLPSVSPLGGLNPLRNSWTFNTH